MRAGRNTEDTTSRSREWKRSGVLSDCFVRFHLGLRRRRRTEILYHVVNVMVNGGTMFAVELLALRIDFRQRDRRNQDRVVDRSQRSRFDLQFGVMTRFIQSESEQPVITLLVGSERLFFAQEHA